MGVGEMWMVELMILVFPQPQEKSQKIVTKEGGLKTDSDFPLLLELHHRKLKTSLVAKEFLV